MNIGQPELATLEFVGQALMVDPEEMHQGGLEIMHVDAIFGNVDPQVVRFSVTDATPDSRARLTAAPAAKTLADCDSSIC